MAHYARLIRHLPGDEGSEIKFDTIVTFEWNFVSRDYNEADVHQVSFRDAVKPQRTVPYPSSWSTVVPLVAALPSAIGDSTSKAAMVSNNANVRCQVLGAPKDLATLDSLSGAPVSVVHLTTPQGTRQDHLLCARVDGDTWICHPGTTCRDGALFTDDPFKEDDLVGACFLDPFLRPNVSFFVARIRYA